MRMGENWICNGFSSEACRTNADEIAQTIEFRHKAKDAFIAMI